MSLDNITYDKIVPSQQYSDEEFVDKYEWLENEVGFYPLFLSVGKDDNTYRVAGYDYQWSRIKSTELIRLPNGESKIKNIYRKKGDILNYVLLSFDNIEGVFMDYDYWHLVLNTNLKYQTVTEYEKRLIFKYSWSKSKWLKIAISDDGSVQFVVPELDLRQAKRVWVRNLKTKEILEDKGFQNVSVKRILMD